VNPRAGTPEGIPGTARRVRAPRYDTSSFDHVYYAEAAMDVLMLQTHFKNKSPKEKTGWLPISSKTAE
jgi:hypothetical protein